MPPSDTEAVATPRFEWPTLGLILLCTSLFVALSLFGDRLPVWLAIALLAIVVTQHSSLQHEVLHGHPFRNDRLNEALVFIPIGLLLPYRRFRDTHLAHHRNSRLTDPHDDPESNFLDPAVWRALGPVTRRLLLVNNTLAGRMLIGPALGMARLYRGDIRAMMNGDRRIIGAYLLHLAGLVPLLWWLATYAVLPLWAYVLAAYGGMSLLKIRTYLEHRAHRDASARSVIIEDRGILSLLFLNNNFHLVHHQYPCLAWYLIPRVYEAGKERFRRQNHGYVFRNYGEIFRRYLFRRKDDVPHPLYADDIHHREA